MDNNISDRDMQQAHDLYQIGKRLSATEIDNVIKEKSHITSLKGLNFFGKIKRNLVEEHLRQNKLSASDIRFLLLHLSDGNYYATKGCLTPFVAYVANENLRDKFTRITSFEIDNSLQKVATIELREGIQENGLPKYADFEYVMTKGAEEYTPRPPLQQRVVEEFNRLRMENQYRRAQQKTKNVQKAVEKKRKSKQRKLENPQQKIIEVQNQKNYKEIEKDSQELSNKISATNSTFSKTSDVLDSHLKGLGSKEKIKVDD